jgi:hypothetical protein
MTHDEYFEREEARLKSEWEAGRFTALIELTVLLSDIRPMPTWAANAVAEQLERAFAGLPPTAGDRTTTRGRSGGIAARMAEDQIHRIRWSMAAVALGTVAGGDLQAHKKTRASITGKKGTVDDAFLWVSEMLRGKRAQAEPEAIKKSYKLVEKELAAGNGARFGISGKNSDN